MKKVSFLVAFLAFLQLSAGSQILAQQHPSDDVRQSVEEALDRTSEEMGEELEELVQMLGLSAERMGQEFEQWAEENSQELEAWTDKYSQEWESWGNRFSQKMERMAADQEDVWGQWAQGYEKNLKRWSNELESEKLDPKQLGKFVESNLKSLSKMPLGQMVDQAMEEGLGELGNAPWESLDELGELAKDALEETRNAIERLDDNSGRKLWQSEVRSDRQELDDARLRALKSLRQRDDMSEQQIERIDELIKTIQDAKHQRADQPRLDVPRNDQLKERISRERKLKQDTKNAWRSIGDAQQEANRKSAQKAKEKESRLPKRADGNNVDGSLKKSTRSSQESTQRFQRDGRDGKANRKPVAESKSKAATKSDAKAKSDIELLREELSRLRQEVQELNKKSDK